MAGHVDDRTARLPALRSVADLLTVGVVVGDADGSASFANRAWTELTGQRRLDWVGHGWLEALSLRFSEDERSALDAALLGRKPLDRTWNLTHPDGRRLTLAVTIAPHIEHDRATGFVATVIDITSQEADVRRLNYQASHDPLTGLLNRPQITEFVRHALERGRREPHRIAAVLFIDVDRLKSVNDRYGHERGDQVLRSLARRIIDAVRPVDVVARYGGDEFVVLCDDLPDREEGGLIAQRIIDAARQRGGDDAIGVSIGVAFAGDPATPPEQLIRAADLAMYHAKRDGGSHHNVAVIGDD